MRGWDALRAAVLTSGTKAVDLKFVTGGYPPDLVKHGSSPPACDGVLHAFVNLQSMMKEML